MTRRRTLIISLSAVVILGLIWVWIALARRDSSGTPSPTGIIATIFNTGNTQTQTGNSVGESAPLDQVATDEQTMQQLIAQNPWAAQLPHYADHFSVYLDSISSTNLTVVLESKNSAEFSTYQTEARAWLNQQGVPTNTIVDYRYRGQP